MSNAIKIITAPSVFLVGRQQIDDAELARFLAGQGVERWTTDTEEAGQKLVEVAGRCCYWSFAKPRPGGNAAYIGHLLEVAHGSCLEHCVFSLIITGVSRSFTHELVRHRAGWSYSQLSQRFVDEGGSNDKPLDVVCPPAVSAAAARYDLAVQTGEDYEWSHLDRDIRNAWWDAVRQAAESYRLLDDLMARRLASLRGGACAICGDTRLNQISGWCPSCETYTGPRIGTDIRKAAREAARSVLPNATETKIFVTANARALRHFLELRGSRFADAEIRGVALELLAVLQVAAGNIFGDYRVEDVGDGVREIVTDHRKV